MPSHDIHRLFAMKYIGVPRNIATEVDRLIDLGLLHDMGRRKPRDPSAYLDIIESGSIEKMYRIKKKEAVKSILMDILKSDVKAKAFYFHHALDVLAIRLASAITLGLEPEKICSNLVRGTQYDLLIVDTNLMDMGIPSYLSDFNQEISRALYLSCIDKTLIKWVKDNIVLRYRNYKSLDYIKERYRSTLSNVLESDAKYEVGISLGLVAHISRMNKIEQSDRVRAVFKVGKKEIAVPDNKLIDKESIDEEYRKVLQDKLGSLSLSPYGLGRLRKTIVVLAALYSDLYHLPFIEPYYLKFTIRELLSVRKKRYTMARKVLKCYSRCLDLSSEARDCAIREVDLALESYIEIINKQRLEDIKNKFIEALEELLKFSNNLGINVLSDL